MDMFGKPSVIEVCTVSVLIFAILVLVPLVVG